MPGSSASSSSSLIDDKPSASSSTSACSFCSFSSLTHWVQFLLDTLHLMTLTPSAGTADCCSLIQLIGRDYDDDLSNACFWCLGG
eukprot:scaffold415925_cov28-Prasinocladus_malaysianus.AAC.1